MREDTISIGPGPAEETCVQVGDPDYTRNARIECRHFIEAIRKVVGREPDGARLTVKSYPHDFGSYYEAAVVFDGNDSQAVEYAYRCEAEAPRFWADAGMTAPDLSPGRRMGQG